MTLSTATNRRSFLQGTLIAGGALLAGNRSLLAAPAKATLPENGVVLFQGDSITDAGRDKKIAAANDAKALGHGYAGMIAAELLKAHPDKNLQIYNRGISGHKVPQLDARWKTDTVDLKPHVLSILIGVNDIWHKINGKYDGTTETYETGFRALLKRTLDEIPGVQIVVCEPFVLRCGAITDAWFPEFDDRRAVAQKLAAEQNLIFVPFQTMFNDALKTAPAEHWARDGVHPTNEGHALMTKTWREVVGI